MDKKLKLALALLLGLAAACSPVKNAPKADQGKPRQETDRTLGSNSDPVPHRSDEMPGGDRPSGDSLRRERGNAQTRDGSADPKNNLRVTLDPVAEKPADD